MVNKKGGKTQKKWKKNFVESKLILKSEDNMLW